MIPDEVLNDLKLIDEAITYKQKVVAGIDAALKYASLPVPVSSFQARQHERKVLSFLLECKRNLLTVEHVIATGKLPDKDF